MRKQNYIALLFVMSVAGLAGSVCDAHPSFHVKDGLAALETGDLEKAESSLQKARFEEPSSFVINYNLGVVSYRKRDYGKSMRFFARASELASNGDERFKAFYNLGNSAFKGYDYSLAITAYKNALAIKTDYQADYNLKVAEKKLQEQLEAMKKQQKQEQQQPNSQNNQEEQKKNSDNSKEDKAQSQQQSQKSDGGKEDSQKGQQNQANQQNDQHGSAGMNDKQQDSGEKGENSQDNNQENSQRSSQGSSQEESQQTEKDQLGNSEKQDGNKETEGEEGEEGEEKSQGTAGDVPKDSESEKKDGDAAKSEDGQASATAPLNEVSAHPEEDRRDVKLSEDKGRVGRPEASQKARAMKNIRLNKKEVEDYLKQMEAREAEAQKYYRINRIEDKDPAYMNQEELREWMRVRNRKREQRQKNQQDW